MTTEDHLREPTPDEIEEAKTLLGGLRLCHTPDLQARWVAACLRLVRAGVPLVKVPEEPDQEGLQ